MDNGILAKLQNMDRRIIYTVIFLVLLVPMFKPIGLPLKISQVTQSAYDTVEALPEGSIAFLTTANAPGTAAELEPQTIALLKHWIKKDFKIIMWPSAAEAPRYIDGYETLLQQNGYTKNVDYLVLPYLAGGETVFGSMAADFKATFNMITPGTSSLWDSIASMEDVDLLADCGGGESQLWAIAHVEAKHGTPTICLITAVILAVRQPYYTSGQFKGIISGLNGAAEYEVMARVPGKGASGMDAQSMGHLWVILTILAGNAAYFLSRGKKSPGGAQ